MTITLIRSQLSGAIAGCNVMAERLDRRADKAKDRLEVAKSMALESRATQWRRAAKAIEAAGHSLPKEP